MFAFSKESLKALASSEKLKCPSSFEAGTVRFLSSTEDTARHAGCVDHQCGETVVYTNHVSGFFLGTGLNLVLWTELPLVGWSVSSGVISSERNPCHAVSGCPARLYRMQLRGGAWG